MGPEGSSVDVPYRTGQGTGEPLGFGRVRERMWFFKEGGGKEEGELQHFSCFLSCVYQTPLFGKFSGVVGVPEPCSRYFIPFL